MTQTGFVVVTDRGGHLHDALRLLDQMGLWPQALVTTYGPDVEHLRQTLGGGEVASVPMAFSWWGKRRFFNPFKLVAQAVVSLRHAARLRPRAVVSTGASDVVLFCYAAWLFGARIYHIENLAQVVHPSITGRLLYPISTGFFVQWEELLKCFGPKAEYVGWVL